MSRSKKKPARRVAVPIAQLNAILERARTEPLAADEHATLKAAVDTLARLTEELETKTTTLDRVRRLIFGPRTETTDNILGKAQEGQSEGATPANPSAVGEASAATDGDTPRKPQRQGHGRNGAEDYPRAPRIPVAHATLKHGDPCPESGCDGRLYLQRQEPAVLVRVTGVAPLQAQVYALDRLRCGLCGTVFTAEPPAGVGGSKYDESAAAYRFTAPNGSNGPSPSPCRPPPSGTSSRRPRPVWHRPWRNSSAKRHRARCSTTMTPPRAS